MIARCMGSAGARLLAYFLQTLAEVPKCTKYLRSFLVCCENHKTFDEEMELFEAVGRRTGRLGRGRLGLGLGEGRLGEGRLGADRPGGRRFGRLGLRCWLVRMGGVDLWCGWFRYRCLGMHWFYRCWGYSRLNYRLFLLTMGILRRGDRRLRRQWRPLRLRLIDRITMVLIEKIIDCCFIRWILINLHKIFVTIEEMINCKAIVFEGAGIATIF